MREQHTTDRDVVDRREILGRSVLGGAALLSMLAASAEPASASQQTPPKAGTRVRRIVTGHNAKGRSCVVSDELVDVGSLWLTSAEQPLGAPAVAAQGGGYRLGTAPAGEPAGFKPSDAPNVDPPVGGTRLSISTIAPTKGPRPEVNNRVGRHTTSTIDYLFVLNGKLVLVLDEQEVHLDAGDLVIQRNTDHAWRNDTDEPVRFLVTIVRFGK